MNFRRFRVGDYIEIDNSFLPLDFDGMIVCKIVEICKGGIFKYKVRFLNEYLEKSIDVESVRRYYCTDERRV